MLLNNFILKSMIDIILLEGYLIFQNPHTMLVLPTLFYMRRSIPLNSSHFYPLCTNPLSLYSLRLLKYKYLLLLSQSTNYFFTSRYCKLSLYSSNLLITVLHIFEILTSKYSTSLSPVLTPYLQVLHIFIRLS